MDLTERKREENERRRLEEKLQRSQKMESLGLLAGGVAHDLNNALAGIVSYPELLLFDLPENSKLRKPVETIMDPGINGRETYERIKKIHPSRRAVIVSRFAETDDVKSTMKPGAGQFIKKPFTFQSLGIAIRKELMNH